MKIETRELSRMLVDLEDAVDNKDWDKVKYIVHRLRLALDLIYLVEGGITRKRNGRMQSS